MFQRMWRASRLDVPFYEMVEADSSYTREAFFVVLLVSVLAGVGAAAIQGASMVDFFIGVISGLISWVAWSGITLFIGTRITRAAETQSDMGEMLRVLGYAQSPQVLVVFAFIPVLGPALVAVAAIWSLIAGVVAIRQALDFTTVRAILTVIFGWVVVWLLRVLLQLLV
ncbi:MAG TPA: YIP1 family protein [Candidatus Eisenbacteria bacterium]|nr:YIP1 family protein [Candidatus Eisenbacteria bacterium]